MKVFYGRVSTKKDEQDSSILHQEEYFKEKGIAKGYIDRTSGTTIDKRLEFQELLKDCGLDVKKIKSGTTYKSVVVDSNRESKIKYIYTKSISRFARNVSECLEITRMLKAKGTYVIFEDINKTTEDESFFLTMSIMATMAENESREKSRSIKMGAKMSAKAGIVRSWAAYGYSYNKEENTLTAIPEEAEIIKKIFELKLKGYGGRRIAIELNNLGYKTRNNKDWLPNVVNRITKNPIYVGLTTRNRYDTNKLFGNNNHKLKPEDEWILINNSKVEPIITQEVFDKCQEIRKNATNESSRAGFYKGKGDLAGKIVCGCCGKSYTRNKDTKVREYGKYERVFYNCSAKKRFGKSACNSKNIPSEEIEKLLNTYIEHGNYKRIANRLFDVIFKEYADKSITELKSSINKDNKAKIESNEIEIVKLKSKLSKLLDMYIDDGIAEEIYKEKEQSLKTKISNIEKENIGLSESETEIMERINVIISIKKNALELVNSIEEDTSREDFIENDLLFIEVKEDGELSIVTKLHILGMELMDNVEKAKSGSSLNDKFKWDIV